MQRLFSNDVYLKLTSVTDVAIVLGYMFCPSCTSFFDRYLVRGLQRNRLPPGAEGPAWVQQTWQMHSMVRGAAFLCDDHVATVGCRDFGPGHPRQHTMQGKV